MKEYILNNVLGILCANAVRIVKIRHLKCQKPYQGRVQKECSLS
jgi:hypothetical protein